MFQRTLVCFRKARITIPQLSPTHSRARIYQWCLERTPVSVESYDPVFVLECSPDLVTPGYRVHEHHQPFMIVEAHDEGMFRIREDIQLNEWYEVGQEIGEIDDGDDDDSYDGEWLWQAYSYDKDK